MPPKRKAPYQGRHQAPASAYPPNPKPGTTSKAPRRQGPQHAAGGAKGPSGAAKAAQSRKRQQAILDEARSYAHREALKAGSGGKPSVTGRALGGAAAGAAAGGAIGNAPGAAVGAGIGGISGAMAGRTAKKAWRMASHASPRTRRIIVAEFLICMIIVGLSPLTPKRKDETWPFMAKRLTAIMGVFLILGLLSAAGRGAAKFAAGVGGLVTLGLLLAERDLFTQAAKIFANTPVPLDLAEADEGHVGVRAER